MLEEGIGSDQPSPNQVLPSLWHTLAVTGVSPREGFELLTRQGFRSASVLQTMLGALPGERLRDSWPRIDFAAELLGASLITLAEAAEALAGVSIHPLSLLGIGCYWDEPASHPMSGSELARTLGLPEDLTGHAHCNLVGGIILSAFQGMESLSSGVKTGNLTLEYLPGLHTLEEGVEVSRSLKIKSCSSLRALPRSIDHVSSLSVSSCDAFEELRLQCVKGDLHVRDCMSFSSLPGPLDVGGSLDLAFLPKLKGLGSNIRIEKDLCLTALADRFLVPEDLQVGERIIVRPPRGSIDLPKRLCEKVSFA